MRSAAHLRNLSLTLALALASAAHAATIYVNIAAPPSGNGSSWSTATPYLDQALAIAQPGDEIWVARGTYRPAPPGSPRTSTFLVPANVTLLGGFVGNETLASQRNWTVNPTILSGDLLQNDGPNFSNQFDNAYHVLCTFSGAPTIDGFTVTAGRGDGVSLGATTASHDQGSGVNVYDASPTIRNCRFTGNYTSNHGTINDHGNNTSVIDCWFEGNYAGDHGAGLYMHHHAATRAIRCTFINNTTPGDGGGLYAQSMHMALIQDCIARNNTANRGAGMYAARDANPRLLRCTFEDNRATLGGGGIYNDFAFSTISNCAFRRNHAGETTSGGGAGQGGSGGGGVWASGGAVSVYFCTFEENVASFGGGVYHNEDSHGTVTSCTFTRNTATEAGGLYILGSPVTAVDCTFVENSAVGSDFSVGGGVSSYFSNNQIIACTFVRNTAFLGGGGHYAEGESPLVDRCVFLGNSTSGHEQGWGGAALNGYNTFATLSNSIFVGNTADQGGAIYNMVFADPTIVNCTIVSNRALGGSFPAQGGAVYTTSALGRLANSITQGNTPEELVGPITVDHSCIQGGIPAGVTAGPGNITAAPRLKRLPTAGDDATWGTTDDDPGDLRLEPGSPCIDAADATALATRPQWNGATLLLDAGFGFRFVDDLATPDTGITGEFFGVPDLGAFESRRSACPSDLDDDGVFDATSPTGDGNPDGGVTIDDLIFFLQAYEAGHPAADLDDGSLRFRPDGAVTVDDLLFLLAQFEVAC